MARFRRWALDAAIVTVYTGADFAGWLGCRSAFLEEAEDLKWVHFLRDQGARFGILGDDGAVTATSLAWEEVLAGRRPDRQSRAELDSLQLLAPAPSPGKIIAIGLNYMDHCREQNVEPPSKPLIFAKFPSALNHPGGEIRWSARLANKIDSEAELAVVIGKTARQVPASDALGHVFGYTCGNDVSARDLQFSDKQWTRGKSLDTFCPLGPVLVTADEIPDPQNLRIVGRVNGKALQDSHTGEMIFSVAELVAYCSASFTLLPGDVILTGTPHGVGIFREPEELLKDGDTVEVEIERIGVLRNTCRMAP